MDQVRCPQCTNTFATALDVCPKCGAANAWKVGIAPASPPPSHDWQVGPKGKFQSGIHWRYLVTAMILAFFGALLISMTLASEWEPAPARRLKHRVLENLVGGPRNFLLISCIAMVVGGFFCAVKAVAQSRSIIKFSAFCFMALIVVAPLSFWAVPAMFLSLEHSWQNRIAAELRPLTTGKTEGTFDSPNLTIREKIQVWDYEKNQVSKVQKLLPEERRCSSSDSSITAILIVNSRDTDVITYNGGERGYQRTLTVCVIDWPEKKFLGVFQIEGSAPGFIHFRKADEERIVGNVDVPLKNWIINHKRRS